MTIHRLTTNIILFALGLNIALASAPLRSPAAQDSDASMHSVQTALTIKALKISRPARSSWRRHGLL